MSVGVIRVELEIRLECDVEDEEAKEVVEMLPDHLIENPIEGIFINDISVKDNTFYDDVPVAALCHPEQNGQ